MTQEVAEFLKHYGVKGMKWGVRRDTSNSTSDKKGDKRLSLKDPRVKRAVAIGGSITAIAVGAFIASRFSDTNMDPATVARGAEEAKRILQEPADLIYLTKPHKG